MKGKPTGFWGKLQRKIDAGDVADWHPLTDHCVDVGACASVLLEQSTWRKRLARFAGLEDLDEVTCSRLAVFATLHDLGKFNIGFQAKGRPELGTTAGHVKEAVAAICSNKLGSLAELAPWGDGSFGLLVSAVCHHGRPYPAGRTGSFETILWNPKLDLDPVVGVADLIKRSRVWFPNAFADDRIQLPCTPEFEHAFAGLVMLADWIGSDDSIFPYSAEGDDDRLSLSLKSARDFVHESWLAITKPRRSERSEEDAFSRIVPGFNPRPVQEGILGLPIGEGPSVTVIESETGSGKTEAALAHFIRLFSKGVVDGMYFALPTRTAATEIHARIRVAIDAAFENGPPVVQAVPGYLKVDDLTGQKLPGFRVLWPDDEKQRHRHRMWAGESPKRYIAGCIVVGTIDQVLLSALRVGHAHLRATTLLRQLLVIDEVHASDAYMTTVLQEVLARHSAAGGHALLMSATLGAESRARLLTAGRPTVLPNLREACIAPYPLISHSFTSEERIAVRHSDSRRLVGLSIRPWLSDIDSVAQECLHAARGGAKVLLIKNTVADCIRTQNRLEIAAVQSSCTELLFSCHSNYAPHHSRFSRQDRLALDASLLRSFGKERRAGGLVVAATQTVQQSLDIDADFLVTDICPMDVLLQRLGRLHRHRRERPTGFENPRCLVVVPSNRDLSVLINDQGKPRHHHGLGSVYDDLRILEATWRQLERLEELHLPEMARQLVEGSLHTESLAAICRELGARWSSHADYMLGTIRGESRQADLNLVDWASPYSETAFPDGERIGTRLGEDDRRLRFKPEIATPFGNRASELVIPGRWSDGAGDSEEYASQVINDGKHTRFCFGDRAFVYDRLGLRPHEDEIAEGLVNDN